MHCMSCKHLIEEDLSDMPGVKSVSVDFPAGHAQIEYDENQVQLEKLKEKIVELGYQAVEAA
jgi:copper chaperone CopZ